MDGSQVPRIPVSGVYMWFCAAQCHVKESPSKVLFGEVQTKAKSGAPKDHANMRILQNMISGIAGALELGARL